MTCEPLGSNDPVQPPDAAHAAASVEVHVRVEVPPADTDVGLADNVAVGAGMTLTVAAAASLLPPAPVQVRENVVAAVIGAVLWLPLPATVPVQPPDAEHDVASVELHVSVEVPPIRTEFGAAERDTVGRAAGAELPPPPLPPQAASSTHRPVTRQYLDELEIQVPPVAREDLMSRDELRLSLMVENYLEKVALSETCNILGRMPSITCDRRPGGPRPSRGA